MTGLTPRHLEQIIRMASSGESIPELIRDDERHAGRSVVMPGDATWLPVTDWHADTVVSVAGSKVRLVLLRAHNPGQGSLRRLVSATIAAGMTPEIVAPTRELQATLTRWGWRRRTHGYGFNSEDTWRPSRAQMEKTP